MDRLTKARIHEIVESVKENYLLNALEESTSEIEVLRTKKFLNEAASVIETVLVEEGVVDSVKEYVKNAYANAAQRAAALKDQAKNYYNQAADAVKAVPGQVANAAAGMIPGQAYRSDAVGGTVPANVAAKMAQMMRQHPGATTAGLAGLGATGLGAAGYGAYEAMQPDDLVDQAVDTVQNIVS